MFFNGLRDQSSILGQVITKTEKIVLDTSFFNIKRSTSKLYMKQNLTEHKIFNILGLALNKLLGFICHKTPTI